MATEAKQFVVKKAKKSRDGTKTFYNEVGRIFLRETEKGVNGTLYLHLHDGEYAVFPVEPKEDAPTGG
jgi:hypothetical protein